jgi:transposase-like protein
MAENLDILNTAVSLLIRAALLAARFSGRARQRSLKRLAVTDTNAKAKEILFLKDKVYQLEMQVSVLQKHLGKKGKSPRYNVRERLLILWQMEAFQIARRKVSRYFGIARSTLYRWLHKIEDQEPTGTPANRTPNEIASLVWEITKANLSWGRIRIANQWSAQTYHFRPSRCLYRRRLCRVAQTMEYQTPFRSRRKARLHRRN